jgi:glucose/arabinose dehydrogenase
MPRALSACAIAIALFATPLAAQDYRVDTLAEDLPNPWAMTFLPGSGDILMTLRQGGFAVWSAADRLTQLTGGPDVVFAGQGGLLDVAPGPNFADTGWIYLTWTGQAGNSGTTTYLGRARVDLGAAKIGPVEELYTVTPGVDSGQHFGSRIAIVDDHVFAGFGDRGFKNFGPDHISQDLGSANGAVIRLELDGTIPRDNPFVGQAGAEDAIWSYGHRNIQAMTVHPDTGEIWIGEHGEAGGDEVNIIERGGNYGWPLASFAVTYWGGNEFAPPHRPGDGFVAPIHNWPAGRTDHNPPSGMTFYTGNAFPEWQGHVLIGNLAHRYLGLHATGGRSLTEVARLLDGRDWRIRDVAVGPDNGFIYVLTDGADGRLLRLSPSG